MRAFLKRKGIECSWRTYFITGLSYMALGLFASLIIGLIMKTAGENIEPYIPAFSLLVDMGDLAMGLMGPAIGVAVAYGLKAPRLVVFAAVITGAAGAELAGPAGSFIAAVLSVEIGKLVSQETKIDIIVTPFVTIVSGFLTAYFIGPWIQLALTQFGELIKWGTEQQPILLGIVVATLMGLALTAPISSAALAIMLELDGMAAGAATVGCAAQMIGFAVSSYRENRLSGLVALGMGTSMLQVPNVMKNPLILIPPVIAGAILAPFATVMFQMSNSAAGAGMGTSGLVGPILTISEMGLTTNVIVAIGLLHFVGPAVISLLVSEWMRKKGLIRFGDMKIDQ
ncbi:PTS transporter subunit IIC [Halalkalibacter sp. APA_J-10(15)]|uniref:PTS transporter subunit IIC n=1 Tax=unclassified Halalkalibacter TaxID=2893063 RepID=UPI001FF384FC|nr:PTS sugar transporter subunit IIC [Halalkalibacter sp. APA_J-10(15)]MCK0471280.1 PTS sugar transporter subunit IIC [Halalkalibacter sp. APA_J-10(15)]